MSLESQVENLSVTISNLTSAVNTMIQMVEQSQQVPPAAKKPADKSKPAAKKPADKSKPADTAAKKPADKSKPAAKKPAAKKPAAKKECSEEELKSLCIAHNRKDKGNHAKLKALLQSFDAVKISDLSAENRLAVAKRIEAEKY